MLRKIFSLFLWIIIFQLVGFVLSQLTTAELPWYRQLHQPAVTPPDIVFAIAWTILYIFIAMAGWFLWENRHDEVLKRAFHVYLVQVVLNWLWTPLFFNGHFLGLGFLCIILLIAATLTVILLTYQRLRIVALLLAPYCIWLCFALYLNGFIWFANS